MLASYAQAEVMRPKNDELNDRINVAKPDLPQPKTPTPKQPKGESISMTSAELQKHPDLIVRRLIPAVFQNNAEAVKILLPLYKNLPQQDRT